MAETARGPLIDTITILLGITVGASTQATQFLTLNSIKIFGLGALSFVIATCAGVLFVKLFNLILKDGNKINPLIGNAGVSAVPDSARISQVVGLEYDPTQLLVDARYGSERSRCNRFRCSCRYLARIPWLIKTTIYIKKGEVRKDPAFFMLLFSVSLLY